MRRNQTRRQSLGLQYSPNVNNNIAIVPHNRNNFKALEEQFKSNLDGSGCNCKITHKQKYGHHRDEMDGEGIMDLARSLYNKGKDVAKYLYNNRENIASGVHQGVKLASDAYSSEIGTILKNALPAGDDTSRPSFPGEKHALLVLKNGSNGIANYMGPGTNVIGRLQRGDPPRTESDKVAMRHDIDYTLAAGEPTKEKQLERVRAADLRMVNSMNRIERVRGDDPRNIMIGKRLIQAKMLGEDTQLLSKSQFAGELQNVSDKDRILLLANQKRLGLEGFGLGLAGKGLGLPGGALMLPGDALKMKLLKQMMKKNKNKKGGRLEGSLSLNSGLSESKTFPSMKNWKMLNGIVGQGALEEFMSSKVVPMLLTNLGLKNSVPTEQISKIISSALQGVSNSNIQEVISKLTKSILPLLTIAKLQSMTGGKMVTRKLHLIGKGFTQILGDSKDMLLGNLSKVLFSLFKEFMNMSSQKQGGGILFSGSGKKKGKGLKLAGQGIAQFWEDFKRGFTSVFKPFAQIAGPVLDALGMPEFGVPLSAIGKIL